MDLKHGFAERLFQGWRVAYRDHGSVVVESPTGFRERYPTWNRR